MSLCELTEFIIKSIVEDTESVKVEEESTDKTITINVTVNESDKGKVIGRGGKVINSIRTILQESSTINNDKYVRLEVNR